LWREQDERLKIRLLIKVDIILGDSLQKMSEFVLMLSGELKKMLAMI
jgi:hypothetical protein